MANILQIDDRAFRETVSGLLNKASARLTYLAICPLPSFKTVTLTFLVATFLAFLIPWVIVKHKKMQEQRKEPFPFMNLPRELRDMVYEHLIEDPEYPPPPAAPTHVSKMSWILPVGVAEVWKSARSTLTQYEKPSTWILLASKQIHKEYTSLLVKRATYHLTVSAQNYQNPTSHPPETSVWNISPTILSKLRSCDLQLITTSSMLGVTDPRNMTSSDWTLAKQIRQDLTALTDVKYFTLESKAIGDPLWNPLWIWYHACQSFKNMGHPHTLGPKLDKITFSLDTWSPGENYMARDERNKGAWTWYCMKGHSVGVDAVSDVTVREFCGMLYRECTVCQPELDDSTGQ